MNAITSKLSIVLAAAAFLIAACQNSTEDNRPLVYDSLDVNFAGTLAGASWSPDDVVGVFATCTRDGAENTAMSSMTPACFHPVSQTTEGVVFNLVKKDEGDNILPRKSDSKFREVLNSLVPLCSRERAEGCSADSGWSCCSCCPPPC